MKIPDEFGKFVQQFDYSEGSAYEGGLSGLADLERCIAMGLKSMNASGRAILRRFLEQLLDGTHTDDEIAEVWRKQAPLYEFSSGGHRLFLTVVQRMLG